MSVSGAGKRIESELYLNEPSDVDRAIAILRRSFLIAREQRDRRGAKANSAEVVRPPGLPGGGT
jgi:hypothetical protein